VNNKSLSVEIVDSIELFKNWYQAQVVDIPSFENIQTLTNVYPLYWSQLHEVFSTTPPLPASPAPAIPDVLSLSRDTSCVKAVELNSSALFEESILPDIDSSDEDNDTEDEKRMHSATDVSLNAVNLVENDIASLLLLQRQKLLESFSIK
jgi:hypothetical protein